MYLQHFGLKHPPLGKEATELWDDGALALLKERFQWLLDSPGVGLLTGEAGVGKTAALRVLTANLNPHRYQLIYLAETDFARLDLYRNLAIALGLEPAFRRAALWRAIKARIQELADGRHVLPAFLNFAFDSRDLMTVWLLGQPGLAQTLDRAPYTAMASRIQVRLRLAPIAERERFKLLIEHGLQQAGATHTLLSDSAMELLRQASRGLPRQAGRLIQTAMRLAVPKGLNHLPDELINEAIEVLQ
jgi:MSHA biogenesis protein MshM